jgi:DNA-binding NtrC family response regulator
MKENVFALMVHDHPEHFRELEGMLKDLSVETWNIGHSNSAGEMTSRYKPDLVFIELNVWDRLHHQLASLARKADPALDIIVVGTRPDINRYVSSIEQGAAGYIAPPFTHDGLSIIVHSAAMVPHVHPVAMAQGASA